MNNTSILFLGKKDDRYCNQAVEYLRKHFDNVTVEYEKINSDIYWWKGEYIISYLYPFVIPQKLLDIPTKSAINFHPGSPSYPGMGCTNFAVYNNEKTYGVTCHKMDAQVDTGEIYKFERFMVYKTDTVYSLTQKCYVYMLKMFYDVMDIIYTGTPLVPSGTQWHRKPYTRKELNDLCIISPYMTIDEIEKRVKATTYPNKPGAYVDIKGVKFKVEEEQ